MAMRNLLFSALILFSSFSYGNELNTLEFTQAYINCIKAFESESTDTETLGIADSGLMNGQVLNGDIDANYWSFMSCITPASAGTTSVNVATKAGCAPEVKNLANPDIQVYLPFKQVGKSVSVNGHQFSCTVGGWDFISSTGQERREGCAAKATTVGACEFNTPILQHNEGGVFFSSSDGTDGSLVAYCDNGILVAGANTCEASACEVGDRVRWYSEDVDGVYICEGDIAANGAVFASLDDLQYYSTAEAAREYSVVPSGNAQYFCEDGKWKRQAGVGACRYKEPAEKVCNEINVGKVKDHFCQ
jgi:hypothetical protein